MPEDYNPLSVDDAFIARVLATSDAEILSGLTGDDIDRLARRHERAMCLARATVLRQRATALRIMAEALRGAHRRDQSTGDGGLR